MSVKIPAKVTEAMNWSWPKFESKFGELTDFPLTEDNLDEWMSGWSGLRDLIMELYVRYYITTTLDTGDIVAEERFHKFLENIYSPSEAAEQKLKQKLLNSKLKPHNFSVQLHKLQVESEIFREANLPLLIRNEKLCSEYDKIVGSQMVELDGQEVTLPQLKIEYLNENRTRREHVWRLEMARWQEDREKINELWLKFYVLRTKIAGNAGYENYREYRWQQLGRFDYSPTDCSLFHEAIEAVVVPAAQRIYEKRRKSLGVAELRPWDLDVDPQNQKPLRPFTAVNELIATTGNIFNRIDPELGSYFATLEQENCLDLDSRKGKGPGGYCDYFSVTKLPFIFMNAVGMHDDVQTLLHEAGHSFHNFECAHLPYNQQRDYSMEIAEVASMSMELLAAPNLVETQGGFYSPEEAARARIEHLEKLILFWPYMSVVDSFQHWAYENPQLARAAENCDRQWSVLWDRFMLGVDWSGLENIKETGWHQKLHIHVIPFYYIEYGIAQLGAAQIWANSLKDHKKALADYRSCLALGATRSLPELFKQAGAKFTFEAGVLKESVNLIEKTISDLE